MKSKCAHSWTHTLQSIRSALENAGMEVMYNIEGDVYSIPGANDISLSFTDPLRMKTIPGNNKHIIYTFETTKLPPGWAHLVNISGCKILSPSKFCSEIFSNNGIHSDKIVEFPLGVDVDIFYKEANAKRLSDKDFIFGTVSINHKRKGILELCKSYLNSFSGNDSVSLVVKTIKTNTNLLHEIDIERQIETLKAQYKNPAEIIVITEHLENTREFYSGLNVFVSATKTEGFFYPALEAMACGIPVICTGYGGHMDFLNSSNSYLIDFIMRDASREEQYWHYYKSGSMISEPDLAHLSSTMKHVFSNYGEATQKAEVGTSTAREMSWDRVVSKLISL